jgi:hypothetical protein
VLQKNAVRKPLLTVPVKYGPVLRNQSKKEFLTTTIPFSNIFSDREPFGENAEKILRPEQLI